MTWLAFDEHGQRTTWSPPTQDGVARRLAEARAGRLRYCHDARAWFVWPGAVWRRDRTGEVLHAIRALAREGGTDPEGRTGSTAGGTRFVAGVERFARGDPAFAVTADAWNADSLRLGTPAGTVDLTTGLLGPADPAEGISLATAVAPADAAACPLWHRFLDETFGGDAELIDFLRRFLGYALTGSVAEQKMLFGWGVGGNGKSVFLNTVLAVMGGTARAAALATLTSIDAERHGAALDQLRGVRLVTIAESDRDSFWSERRLKLLTGGDAVVGRGGDFTPSCKLLAMGNAPPTLRNVDEAMRRRLRIVPFHHHPARPDRGLEAKLRAEAPAILRWMIEGCLAWQAEGLGSAAAVQAATIDYVADSDGIGRFLAARCNADDKTRVTTAAALFAAWRAWAEAVGEEVGSPRAFGMALMDRGYRRDRTDLARGYVGVSLHTPDA